MKTPTKKKPANKGFTSLLVVQGYSCAAPGAKLKIMGSRAVIRSDFAKAHPELELLESTVGGGRRLLVMQLLFVPKKAGEKEVSDTEKSDLKPCPFCGSAAELKRNWTNGKPSPVVECTGCGCQSSGHNRTSNALAKAALRRAPVSAD